MSPEPAYRILILGGYGNFGLRIARALAVHPRVHVLIAGRNLTAAQAAARGLSSSGAPAQVEALAIQAEDSGLATLLRNLKIQLVIHTAGPFQGQSYTVARACIEVAAHYIDLADGRAFVEGIAQLDADARAANVLIVSGASTVPAVSAAVIDRYRSTFVRIRDIAIGITPGNRTPRGLSTVESVLSYCGRPFRRWEDGHWRTVYGWQDLHRVRYPKLGMRWFSNCDVPDLALFPQRYAAERSVTFHAGLELSSIHLSLWLMSWLARWRIVRNWLPAAKVLKRASEWLLGFGSDAGGMHVKIVGTDSQGNSRTLFWVLTALAGHGPQIPCIASIVIARKLVAGELDHLNGARPCLDLMTLDDFAQATAGLQIEWKEFWNAGV